MLATTGSSLQQQQQQQHQRLARGFSRTAHAFQAALKQQNMKYLQIPAAVQHTAPLGCSSSSQQQHRLMRTCLPHHVPRLHLQHSTSISRRHSSQHPVAASSSASSSLWAHSSQQQQRGVRSRHSSNSSSSSSSSSSSQPRRHLVCRARSGQQPPDPWNQAAAPGGGGGGSVPGTGWSSGFNQATASTRSSSSSQGYGSGSTQQQQQPGPLDSFDPWDAAAPVSGPVGGVPEYERTDWGWDAAEEDWDPADGLGPQQLEDLEREYLDQMQRRRAVEDPPRDKWITPLLDWQSISGAFDPDQSRTEDAMADEALTNKEESREALSFTGRLVAIPLVTGALISRAITDPVLSFSLQNNPKAFAMSEHQKIEGATAVHLEEARVRMMMAIGQAPPLDDEQMLQHLREYAHEVQEEERHKNEASLMTLVSDSISAMVFFAMFLRDTAGRAALFNTIGRLFEGLSDIAKAVMIILVADTLLGYHSEEGWTGFLDLFLGHYGIEVEEENIVLFVGIIPIAIDVLFKYWIFIGLNKISPGAVVTIKQLDRH